MIKSLTRQTLEEFLCGCKDCRVSLITGNSEDLHKTVYSNSIIANTIEFLDGDNDKPDAVVFSCEPNGISYAEVILVVNNLLEVYRDDEILVCVYPCLEINIPDMDKYPYIVIEKEYTGKEENYLCLRLG